MGNRGKAIPLDVAGHPKGKPKQTKGGKKKPPLVGLGTSRRRNTLLGVRSSLLFVKRSPRVRSEGLLEGKSERTSQRADETPPKIPKEKGRSCKHMRGYKGSFRTWKLGQMKGGGKGKGVACLVKGFQQWENAALKRENG